MPSQAFDADGDGNQAVPIGTEMGGDVEGFDQTMLLPTMADAPFGVDRIKGMRGGTNLGDRVEQGFLVGLDLGEEEIAGVPGCLKSFFDSAWRRR